MAHFLKFFSVFSTTTKTTLFDRPTRIYPPLSAPKAVINSGLSVPERFWGSYRSDHSCVFSGCFHFGKYKKKSFLRLTSILLSVQRHNGNPGPSERCVGARASPISKKANKRKEC